ncbi:MAG: hypothetical protein ACREQ4_12845 [Candidatus Binataceae bacterium]
MRHALVDEAVADMAVRRLGTRRDARRLGFLELTFAGIGQQVKRTRVPMMLARARGSAARDVSIVITAPAFA